MKYYILVLVSLIAIFCFSQDSHLSWNGMYLCYNTYEGQFLKDKTTVFDFEYLYLFDLIDNQNPNHYFFYTRVNYFSDSKKRLGGGVWGKMVVKNNAINTYNFLSEVPLEFTFNKEYESFNFEDYTGPNEVIFIYTKLFPLGIE
ncbi:MAG TPA: hypothetical protein P5519_04110 [Spirochaetia bacterium]|nr:hypothetical protein [Spirochaetales bacterium]HQG39709.1 hypothetical protein [Spirochaetales bacterium]HQK33648.1 hypothetical protein [Spirochaetales bacterium]HRS65055.1 hypothetical protein [Spirochaetia bacterium]